MTDIVTSDGKLWTYTDKVKDHFFNPRGIIKTNEEEALYDKEADGIGSSVSAPCGDSMKMWLKIKDDKIAECRWRTFGCAAAIAATSIFAEKVIGMEIKDALELNAKTISKDLDELPARKLHCAGLVSQTFKVAIDDYLGK